MVRRLNLLAALLLPMAVFCQSLKNIPEFGKVDKADLLQNNCSFDKNAEAMVICDYGEYYFDIKTDFPYSELQRHVRIKILNNDGLEWSNVRIQYKSYKNEESISGLVANIYNLNDSGNVVVSRLDKKQVYTKRLNSKYSEQSFALPDAKAGSIIEYKYTVKGANMYHWYMQYEIPVKMSKYVVDFPSEYEFHLRPMCTLPYEFKDLSNGARTIKEVTMLEVPALRNEKYMICKEDYLQKVESWLVAYNSKGIRYPFKKTWPQLAYVLAEDEDFGVQMKKNIPLTTELDAMLKKINDPLQKMLSIHNYVRNYMEWDGQENLWALNGVKTAWKEKKGTSGEINIILINLLRDAGINALPVLVSTHDNGQIARAYPSIQQFNKVMAYVKLNDRVYVLDGSDKYTSAYLIPENILYTQGWVIDGFKTDTYDWEDLMDNDKIHKNTIIFQATITPDGQMKGKASVTSADYAGARRRPLIKEGQQKYIQHFYTNNYPGLVVDSLEFKNESADSLPLVQSFIFNAPVNSSGEYSYFSANMFTGISSNPFIADERFSDVFFGAHQNHTVIASFIIPEGYELEALPQNTRMTLEDKTLVVTRMSQLAGSILNVRLTIDHKKSFYTPSEYSDLKEFYKKMYALLDEQFVIKKKNG